MATKTNHRRAHSASQAQAIGDVVGLIARILDQAGAPYMLVGSIAAARHGAAREPGDIDLVVQLAPRPTEKMLAAMAGEWEIDEQIARERSRSRGDFSAVHQPTGVRVDFHVHKVRSFSREEFARRQRVSLYGHEVWVASAEDTVLASIDWSAAHRSAAHLEDARTILEQKRLDLDILHIERWVGELGLTETWKRLSAG